MAIFAIRNDGCKYQELDLDVNDFIEEFPECYDYGQCHDFSVENISMLEFWQFKRTGFREIEGEENLIPDITSWIDATLLLSPKAYRLLSDTLSPFGEFLPIMIEMETYYIFNCLTVVDVIEEKSSDTSIEFDMGSVSNTLIFKTRFQRCLDLFCLERLKTIVEGFELKGIVFDSHLGTFRE